MKRTVERGPRGPSSVFADSTSRVVAFMPNNSPIRSPRRNPAGAHVYGIRMVYLSSAWKNGFLSRFGSVATVTVARLAQLHHLLESVVDVLLSEVAPDGEERRCPVAYEDTLQFVTPHIKEIQ